MGGYWVRHRFLHTLIFGVALAAVTALLFVFPYISQQANTYNAQSVYKNTDIDFIAPEPSFEQVSELPGNYGIDKVFPYYLTKASVSVNGSVHTSTVLLSDYFQNIDITMYNDDRLIERLSTTCNNPILVDWDFCKNTSANIGDKVSFNINGTATEYTIYAVYETNSIYDGGTLLVEISSEQKEAISQNSKNNGYSGVYISARDYSICQSYLTTEYRPLGRLKSPEQFDSEEQYQIHYNAIMESSYANEITDFRVRENNSNPEQSDLMVWIGVIFSSIAVLLFNIVMFNRGCEKNYFVKNCVPKGRKVKPYYSVSFFVELVLIIGVYIATVVLRTKLSTDFIPKTAFDWHIITIPIAVVVIEAVCLKINGYRVSSAISRAKSK